MVVRITIERLVAGGFAIGSLTPEKIEALIRTITTSAASGPEWESQFHSANDDDDGA
jgi:hypothetical protein